MLSDVLADAIEEIKRYQADPLYADWYGDLAEEVGAVTVQMDALRFYLDSGGFFPAAATDEEKTALRKSDRTLLRARLKLQQ